MKSGFLKRMLSAIVAAAISAGSFAALTVPAFAENEPAAWTAYANYFDGTAEDNSIVWAKYSGDSANGQWNKINDVVTLTDDGSGNKPIYAVTAVIKNIKPSTRYTVTFEEKADITAPDSTNNGLYVSTDTNHTTVAQANASSITSAVTTRKNGKQHTSHKETVTDADWETKSFTWESGSHDSEYETLAAKFSFMMRDVFGSWKIRNLRVVEEAVEASTHFLTYDTEKNPLGEFSVSTDSGTPISAATSIMQEGDKFKVDVTPNTGYTGTVKVKTASGAVEPDENGVYTMPAADADISVSYTRNRENTSRIAAINSAATNSGGTVSGGPDSRVDNNGSNDRRAFFTVAAGRIGFLKFDLSNYSADEIETASLSWARQKGTAPTKALFYVSNDYWSENTLSSGFKFNGTDALSTYFDKTAVFSDWNDDTDKANANYDTSTAAEGTLKDYYLGSYDSSTSVDITAALKAAMAKDTDKIITFMVYSTYKDGYDVQSVLGAVDIASRPSITIKEKSYAASLTHEGQTTEYEKFEDACRAAANGDTITLLSDVKLSARMIFDNNTGDDRYGKKSNITIDGGDDGNGGHYSIDNNGKLIEFPSGSGTVTLNNLTINGSGKFDAKGDTVINANGTTISNLALAGSANSKGTLTNSNIGSLSTYGSISLVNTTLGNIEFLNINSSTNDRPQITGDADSAVTGTVSFGASVNIDNITFPYTLFAGEMTKPAVDLANTVFADGYKYSDGVLKGASSYIITVQEGITADKTAAGEGETVTLTVTGDKYVKNSLTASYEPYAHNLPWGGTTEAPYSLPLTSAGENTYTFTMPDDDVNVTALFEEEDETVVASQDQAYGTSDYSADSWHYIQTGSKSLALGFDLTGIENIENKAIKLILKRQGGAQFTQTSVRLATANPWAGGTFAAFDKAENKLATATQAEGDIVKLEFKVSSSNLIDNHLYLNVEMDEGSSGNDYYGIRSDSVHGAKQAPEASYLPRIELRTVEPHSITAQDGITASASTAVKGETVTLTGNYAAGSLIVKAGEELVSLTKNDNGTYSFTMPNADVEVAGLINTENKIYVVPESIERVNGGEQTDNRNYYIAIDRGLGMSFNIPDMSNMNKELASVQLHFTRQNTAPGQTTNIYDQTSSGFNYVNGEGYIAQYSGGSIDGQKLNSVPAAGAYKLLLAYDAGVASTASGNDYYVVNANSGGTVSEKQMPKEISHLPYLVFSFREPAPDKKAPSYSLQTDTQDDMFQYHYAGGTTAFNQGTSEEGKAYDAYLWVPPQTAPGELKGLVAIKMNLVEVPFAYSSNLRNALAEKNFGILFLVCQKDPYGYNNTLNGFYTRNDYAGNPITYTDSYKATYTTDDKDAADILNEILAGVAGVSGYSEIEDTVPLITIGHSAASGFGNKSANWNKNRVIAQIHMKNGMSGEEAMVPGVPQLQYAAQYTEHANGADRDRSVRDARYHIRTKRAVNENYLVSHIIEWGSGHYDWSENATYMLTKYIIKAIEARLPDNYSPETGLNDLTNSGYLMKPFEKDAAGSEQEAGYYRDYLQGWLSSGQDNASASEADKKASFWFFDENFAKEVNEFTNYAIPESPDSRETGVSGKTYSDSEPFMLMRNPALSTYAENPGIENNAISPFTTFASNPFSRYGNNRFINYTRLTNSSTNNIANMGGYDTVTVDTYYMNKVPSITTGGTVAYDGAGGDASYPQGQKAEFVPLIAPYEVVDSELLEMSTMAVDSSNTEAANAASVTRTTLRFHNNRVYFRSGNKATLGENYNIMDSYGFIKSPEIREGSGFVTSSFKATSSQMNIPYVTKGAAQTIELNKIEDVNIYGATTNPLFDVTYTSTDPDLQKYTDVFVEYGPAKAVRTVNEEDGSYSWKIEILIDQIPENAAFPLEVNVVVSNLGKWENTYGATVSQTFNIVSEIPEITDVTITPYEGSYDGNAHGIELSGIKADDVVEYKVGEGEYSATAPTYTAVGEYPVTVKVTRANHKTLEKEVIIKITNKPDIEGVTVTPYSGTYDKSAHDAVTSITGTQDGDVIKYTLDGGEESAEMPKLTDAGEYTVAVKIEREGYNSYTQNVSVKIEKATAVITAEEVQSATFDGTAKQVAASLNNNEGVLSYSETDMINADTYTVVVSAAETKNYTAAESKTVVFTINKAIITGITVTGYTGKADGQPHKVTVSGAQAEDTIEYKVNGGEFMDEEPSFTDVGEYSVTVKIIRENYEDYTETVIVSLTEEPPVVGIIVTPYRGEYDGSAHDAVVVMGTQEGDTVTYQVNDGEISEIMPQLTEEGTYTIKVTVSRDGFADYVTSVTVTIAAPSEPEIVIGDIDNTSDKTVVIVSVSHPNEETEQGLLIAALYDEKDVCIQVKLVTDSDGIVEFDKSEMGYIKAFLWNGFSGMRPIIGAQKKSID